MEQRFFSGEKLGLGLGNPILILGAGDIASGIAMRLWRSGFPLMMTDLEKPTSIRRTVCFSEAVVRGETVVEDVRAKRAASVSEAKELLTQGILPVLADDRNWVKDALRPKVLVDGRLAKRNLGVTAVDAPLVIGVGPGFSAGGDCHAVVETMRGHTLGRVLYHGSAIPNTGAPGSIGGYTVERLLRAPADGVFHPLHTIGEQVVGGDAMATVDGVPMLAQISGVLRGILPEGTVVFQGMKSGDIDPRCAVSHCYFVSDKALAVGGGVLEALLALLPAAERCCGRCGE